MALDISDAEVHRSAYRAPDTPGPTLKESTFGERSISEQRKENCRNLDVLDLYIEKVESVLIDSEVSSFDGTPLKKVRGTSLVFSVL